MEINGLNFPESVSFFSMPSPDPSSGQVGFIISASITYNRSKSGRGRIKNKWAAALAHTSNVKVDYF